MSRKLNTSTSGTPKSNKTTNTLFNYFARSPGNILKTSKSESEAGKENVDNGGEVIDISTTGEETVQHRLDDLKQKEGMDINNVCDDDDEVIRRRVKKRHRILLEDSEEEDINEEIDKDIPRSDPDFVSDNTDKNYTEEPKRKKSKLHSLDTDCSSIMKKIQNLQEKESTATDSSKVEKYEDVTSTEYALDEPTVWPHQKLEFLKPEKIRDKKGRRPDHKDYDPSTLEVPATFLDSLSPAVRQWWVLKSDHFDCILFFKVGKFYELYHMDADVGVKVLGFTYMRGEFAHSGFPEISYDKMASILVDRGYKVARVEQTETPEMMMERCKHIKPSKFDKVVRREICQITNKGTQVFGSQCTITPNHQPNYMLCVVEKYENRRIRYGICYIDTSIGDFYIGEFDDDKNCSRFLTLISHNMPVLVLSERSSLSERTQQIFRTLLGGVLKEYLPTNSCSGAKTLKHLAENYFVKSSEDNWPLALRNMQAESDHLGLTPSDSYELALKALGGCIAYISKCKLEEKILPMARFHEYTPPDILNKELKCSSMPESRLQRAHMVIDSTTLSNLRIIEKEHSLLTTLDNCCTKFGKRLLHYWLCAPSCDIKVIVERQQAISALINQEEVLQEMRSLLAPMPDFERHLSQIHLFGNKQIMEHHPDGRAILFEDKLYNKKKIQNFITILKAFETLTKIPQIFRNCDSPLIKYLTQLPTNGGRFPDMGELLEFFKTAFDHNEAAKSGIIAPEKGVDAEYDGSEAKISEINESLNKYLAEQEKFFGCRVKYFGTDKKRFQLEIPESNTRKAGKEYSLEGQRKGFKRYSTQDTRNFLKELQNAEEERNSARKDILRRIFEKFSSHFSVWKQCVDCVANLDVLGSLAEYARNQQVICVPDVQGPQTDVQPFIDIDEGYHPCASWDTYIPNGITLGVADVAPLSVLTGPNMGGKSTLMRQVGLLVIMTQIGAHVPARHCKISIVDRIFTRLGAQDDILSGHSTFLVELNETSLILKHATHNSLVLLDELGRGTATYDGTAIAASVVNYMADLKCRTLFSTHYHNLVDYFHEDKRICLGHMACMVENEGTEDPTQETVTFLYKYSSGPCPKSYGFNAAKLAGMPHAIIKRAYELSKRVEAIALKRKITSKIISNSGNAAEIATLHGLLLQLKMCRV